MRERKSVKFRVDMYEDTKFKIIDRMVRRDLIHYVWNRSVILAGKVNREGDLYMSKNIPYTVETLVIEFNRDMDDMDNALKVLIELEMIEVTEDKVYRVKNFAKHQNIKVKEKTEIKEQIKIKEKTEAKGKEDSIAEKSMIENKVYRGERENEGVTEKNEETKERLNKFDVIPLLERNEMESDSVKKCDNKIDQDIENEESSSSQHNNSPVILEMKKSQKIGKRSRKVNKNKIIDEIIETDEDMFLERLDKEEDIEEKEDVCSWSDGEESSFKDGERLVSDWSF